MNFWKTFTVPLENTLQRIVAFLPRLLVAILLFLIFYAIAAVARKAARRTLGRFSRVHWALRLLIARAIYIVTLLLGLIVAFSAANIDVTAVLTSLGVAGFAIGFALKDILENFISGILLLFARPFEIGDQVMLGNYEGVVTDIQLRTTSIRTYDDEMVMIPNSDVYTHPVVNHTRLGQRRYTVDFETSLRADIERVEREALLSVTQNADVSQEPAPFVRVTKIDSSADALAWRIFYWAAPTKAIEVKTTSAIIEHIKRALFDAGVPTPTASSLTLLQRAAPTASAPDDSSNSAAVSE